MKTLQRWKLQAGMLVMLAFLSASCVTTRKVAYLQDMTHASQIELEHRFEAVVSPYDELDIFITCYDKELAAPFNIRSNTTGNNSNQRNLYYLVDQDGNIELPVLGTVHAGGLTRLQLQDKIRDMLIKGNYLSDPYVMVRFQNFKVFFLGSNGGKAITIENERCTFLEALAMAGGLNQYTKRDKIAVMREENGKIVTRFLDPRSTDVIYDPYFLLQQNDIIVTQSFRRAYTQQNFDRTVTIVSALASVLSSAAMIYLVVTGQK